MTRTNSTNNLCVPIMVIIVEIFIVFVGFIIVAQMLTVQTLTAQTHYRDTHSNCAGCDAYLESRMPDMPKSVTTMERKMSIINSWIPRTNSIAVIFSGDQYGQLAYVLGVENDGNIVLEMHDCITNRLIRKCGTPTDLSIQGYFRFK